MIRRLLRASPFLSAPASAAMVLALMSVPAHQPASRAQAEVATHQSPDQNGLVTKIAYARVASKVLHYYP